MRRARGNRVMAIAAVAIVSAGALRPAPATRPAPAETAGSADAFVNSIGSNAHLSYTNRPYFTAFSTIIVPRVRELGIRHLRINGIVLPDDRWMRQVYSNANALYHDAGVTYDLIATPVSQPRPDSSHFPFDRLFEFMDPASIDMVEGINEPDYPDKYPDWAAQATAWQQALYAAVKSNPRLAGRPVLGPALVHGRLSATAIGDLSAAEDLANAHPYPGGRLPSVNLASQIEERAPENGSRPYVITETGYHTAVAATKGGHPGVSELAMGKYLPRLFFEYWNAGIRRTYQYEFIDEGTDPSDPEQHFGLLRNDGSPKPAFTALKNLIALLGDSGHPVTLGSLSYSLTGASAAVHHTLLEKADGRFYLVLWQEVASYDIPAKRDLAVPPQNVRVTLGAAPADVKI
jgi:hypothetical protein